MKRLLLIMLLLSLLFGGDCIKKYTFEEDNHSYIIHVFDYVADSEIEDLSLEAKMYLFVKLKEKYKRKIYALKIKRFRNIDNYKCGKTIHSIFKIDKKDIQIGYNKEDSNQNAISYRSTRRKILKKIAFIEVKDRLTLDDYKKLYTLYFALGKISDANRIMDKIIELKWRN